MAGRTRGSSNSPTGHGGSLRGKNNDEDETFKYESLLAKAAPGDGDKPEAGSSKAADALSSRLTTFREWLLEEAGVTVHPSICIVNGEATDGTKNAPVLAFGPPPGSQNSLKKSSDGGRAGLVDGEVDRALYDRTMGCCVRSAKEIKKDEVIMTVPRSAMVTPDLVASSDAAKAVLACCKLQGNATETQFWDAFENTTICETKFTKKIQRIMGAQMLVKILQERKRAENAYTKAVQKLDGTKDSGGKNGEYSYKLAQPGAISTRAAFLAFLIHQRFSDKPSPPVSSDDPKTMEEFKKAKESGNALKPANSIVRPPGSPASFAAYARTLPSSISLPLSWQREELALLSGCISGSSLLQEVAARTLQLSSEFIALLEAGILHRFPKTFPRGMITWERWVWAAACVQSRMLPATCYLNDGEKKATQHVPSRKAEFQSPPEIWDEIGVMVPLMDMINHEVEANQVTWKPCVPSRKVKTEDGANGMEVDEDDGAHPPQAIVHKRVRKGSQIYCCYGNISNHNLLLQYGFAQLGNLLDDVRIGWSLADCVGNIERPTDFESPVEETATDGLVYDSTDAIATEQWWTDDRLAMLKSEAFNLPGDTAFTQLKNGKKMSANASSDGTFDPFLLASAAIATMPVEDVKRNAKRASGEKIVLTNSRQRILRSYLTYFFTRKMEKLLQNVNTGLKNHFKPLNLWTKAKEGGLRYKLEEGEGAKSQFTGWQTFFEAHAYNATVEAENHYYAMGAESCVLTLFDGQLRSLQASLDGLASEEKFKETILKQLEDLDFKMSTEEGDGILPPSATTGEEPVVKAEEANVKNEQAGVKLEDATATNSHHNQNGKMELDSNKSDTESNKPDTESATKVKEEEPTKDDAKGEKQEKDEKDKEKKENNEKDTKKDDKDSKSKPDCDGGQKKKEEPKKSTPSKSSRRRNKRKNAAANNTGSGTPNSSHNHMGDRPPAIKLHIGNLAYSTTQSTLYEFFSAMCGRESVLECHIPTERDTGRSRGFGFVTLPEPIARNILKSGKKHEVDGRPLKIAESNSAGSGKSARLPPPPPMPNAGERCSNCGYRPKYCTCRAPSVPGFGPLPPPPPPPPTHGHPHGPPMDMRDYGGGGRDYDYYSGGGGAGRFRDDRFGQGNSPYNRPRPDDRDRPYGREPDRPQWGYHRERSRSRSYGRDEGRMRDRSRRDRRGRERSRSRSRSPRGRRDRGRESDRRWGHRRSTSRSRSRSRSYSSGSSRSRSPPHGKRDHDSLGPSRKDKKNDGVGAKEDEVGGANASSGNKPRETRKRSHSRGGGGRKKKKSKRRSGRSRSRSRSRSPPSPRGG